jgi:hypothetical protein
MQQGILGPFRQQSGAVSMEQQSPQPGDLDLAPWFDSLLVRLVILVSMAMKFSKHLLHLVQMAVELPSHNHA